MNTLRVLLPAPPSTDRADHWALFDATGRVLQRGQDVPANWPQAEMLEAVLAADLVRVVALSLPPMAPSRVAAASVFALEDQLATTTEAPAIAVTAQRADGSVLATVAARATLTAIARHRPPFDRAIGEPALAPVHDGWTWYASGAGTAFVKRRDGSTFTVASSAAAGDLPAELASALTQSGRAGDAPPTVFVADRCTDDALSGWSHATGVRFARASPWRWDAAASSAFADAPDLLQKERAQTAALPSGDRTRWFRPALVVAALALGVHVAATVAQWLWLNVDNWRTSRAIVALAQDAGVPDATSPDAAMRGLARRHAELRHRAGLSVPADALPLLARAAAPLAALPPGALKSATYADGAWTMEIGPVDANALAAVDRSLSNAGVAALQAKTAAGYRMRVTPMP